MADQVGSLIALTARGLRDAALVDSTPAVRSLSDRILDCIAQRCIERELTAADVAKSLDISVRTLHRAFVATNATFGEKLIEARARVALRMLTSPMFDRVTTAEIGKRAGFLSASHFARVMRNQTGHTPLHLRRAAGIKEPDAED
jgi:AraC-like DNA-binding protein